MSRLGTMMGLSQAAWQECALLGHREIDVEHVMLAAIDDLEVATMLARHGVTREGTRQQVDAVVRDQLAALGVDLDVPTGNRRGPDELHADAVGELDITDRAQRLLSEARSPAGVLLAVLEARDGTGAALLQRQGADPGEIRADLERLVMSPAARRQGGAAEVDPSELPDSHLIEGAVGQALRRSRFYAVSWEQVWPLVSTAEGAARWLLVDGSTSATGTGELGGPLKGHRWRPWSGADAPVVGRFTRRLLSAEKPHPEGSGHVLWQDRMNLTRGALRREYTGPSQWFHVTVTPQGQGSRVDLVIGSVVYRRKPRLVRPYIRLGQSWATRNALYQLGLVLENTGGES